jgi:hypothetical protein
MKNSSVPVWNYFFKTKNIVITPVESTKNFTSRSIEQSLINRSDLQNISMKLEYNKKVYNSVVYVKYDKPLPLSNSNTTQSGTCVLFYHDGLTNSIQPINGIYTVEGSISKTINITCGDSNDPNIQLTITSSSTDSELQVVIQQMNVGIVLQEDHNSKDLINLSAESAGILGFIPRNVDSEENAKTKSHPYIISIDNVLSKGSLPFLSLPATANYIDEQHWNTDVYKKPAQNVNKISFATPTLKGESCWWYHNGEWVKIC